MAIYAIADLHLSFKEPKPMNIFGDNWENHEKKIKNNWEKIVKDDDIVLLPGDFSWATYLEDAYLDFEYLDNLPGKKIMLKGNHDYWWTTVTSMKKYLTENNFKTINFLYNNSYFFDDYIIVGTRGWGLKDEQQDQKIINRELGRLEMSIKDGIQKYGGDKKILVCMHYPPVTKSIINDEENYMFINLMKKYKVNRCIYGHLHGKSQEEAIAGDFKGIKLELVSSDYLDFNPIKI